MPISEIRMYGKNERILYVWFRKNREKISNHGFCLIKLNGLREELYSNEIAPQDTQMCIDDIFRSHESFVGLYFLDLENETLSQHHCHNKFSITFDLEHFFENLKNISIDFFKPLNMYAWQC